jgi:hypothetical protein
MFNFKTVDTIIDLFVRNKRRVKVSYEAKTDWCQFEYRRLEWKSNSINRVIEIFPDLKNDCTYEKWNLVAIACYDENFKDILVATFN